MEKTAIENLQKDKTRIYEQFRVLLNRSDVNSEAFDKLTEEITEIQAIELGEYIVFRQQIIEMLKKLSIEHKVYEDKIHNLFMKMGATADTMATYDTNIWLLDDKFMTFTYAASDKTMSHLKKILLNGTNAYKPNIEPDISLFYSKPEMTEDKQNYKDRDAVLIELKGIGTSNKDIAITELPKNLNILRKNVPNINQLWGYIITTIDKDFEEAILSQARYKRAFSNGYPMYYDYFPDPAFANVYIMDIRAIIADAEARNKVFLDILKKQ